MRIARATFAFGVGCFFLSQTLLAVDPPVVPQPPVQFTMVDTGKSPYPLNDRKDLSLNTGGAKLVWATADQARGKN
ncbi:MAG: hypothetical protein CMO74_07935 [Verrucomicrobiales bacterium]|nr:hypothetical protein [Verrucomicrobiales bacterium]|tara:strand:+ start:261 stop:488 length:228 start_codon:yes stop_codon:yes gene_type:complete